MDNGKKKKVSQVSYSPSLSLSSSPSLPPHPLSLSPRATCSYFFDSDNARNRQHCHDLSPLSPSTLYKPYSAGFFTPNFAAMTAPAGDVQEESLLVRANTAVKPSSLSGKTLVENFSFVMTDRVCNDMQAYMLESCQLSDHQCISAACNIRRFRKWWMSPHKLGGQHTNWSWAGPPFLKWQTGPRSICKLVGGSYAIYESSMYNNFSASLYCAMSCVERGSTTCHAWYSHLTNFARSGEKFWLQRQSIAIKILHQITKGWRGEKNKREQNLTRIAKTYCKALRSNWLTCINRSHINGDWEGTELLQVIIESKGCGERERERERERVREKEREKERLIHGKRLCFDKHRFNGQIRESNTPRRTRRCSSSDGTNRRVVVSAVKVHTHVSLHISNAWQSLAVCGLPVEIRPMRSSRRISSTAAGTGLWTRVGGTRAVGLILSSWQLLDNLNCGDNHGESIGTLCTQPYCKTEAHWIDQLCNDVMQHLRTPFPTISGSNSVWTFRWIGREGRWISSKV